MEVLKQATAIPIFGTTIWLVWLFASSTSVNALTGLLLAFLLLAIAGWVLGRWPAKRVPSLVALLVIIAAIAAPLYAVHVFKGVPVTAVAGSGRTIATGPRNWQPFTPGVVAGYQAQGRPVLVDFTADWCLSCQVNERVVLDRPEVQARLHSSNIALVRADWTHHDDDIAQALAQLGRSGVPAYAVYPATAGEPPVLLPEVLTSDILFSAVDKVAKPKASLASSPSVSPSAAPSATLPNPAGN
jgi:thiol:disulfide interchange protein DsbD